ncbi:DoxX family membrane protein [Neobacillus sp. YIM B06451]|uniref:DoxX family membrane protein n=1 Tax=Neobacillus sp. YIM B06451 TaxID=3070994 RepID=UPI00292F8BEA|nr:DoxX family membrane protein [Neobacillus sp. YIM B06451]
MAKRMIQGIVLLGVLLLPLLTSAHVKWFAEVKPERESIENILSPLFITVALLFAVLLAVLSQVMHKLTDFAFAKRIDQWLEKRRPYSRYLLKYGTALALLLQVFSGSTFAPEFHIEHTWETVLMWAAIILLIIPHHLATKVGAVVLFILFVNVTMTAGWFHMLDYGFYLAIIGVLLVGKTKWEDWGFPFLYLGTGLSLCWVAVEKWVFPNMTLQIIQHHHVPTFGFPADTFIVLAAFIEFVVGYLLVVGILNRILAVVVTVLFILTTMIFGYTEVVGHAMIHIVLLIFIIEGVSFYQPPIKMHKTRLDQMVFVFLNFIFVLSTFLLIYYRFA